jgi:hypothetical protein
VPVDEDVRGSRGDRQLPAKEFAPDKSCARSLGPLPLPNKLKVIEGELVYETDHAEGRPLREARKRASSRFMPRINVSNLGTTTFYYTVSKAGVSEQRSEWRRAAAVILDDIGRRYR